MPENWTEADDIIEEVRAIRRQIGDRFDNDPMKYGAYLREWEKNHKGLFIELPDDENRGQPSA